jgi:5-methylthioadenosine/S-adenosylhomocysteine deaminase
MPVNTAIGMNEAVINGDRDLLQEMRMVPHAHRVLGMENDVPTSAKVLGMATIGGTKTTACGDTIGALGLGRAAGIVLVDWEQVSFRYLDSEKSLVDAMLQRAETSDV